MKPSSDLLGSHISTAGGVTKAFERAAAVGCAAIQIFTKNNFQWRAKPLAAHEASEFRKLSADLHMPVGAHSGYLINLGVAKGPFLAKSVAATIDELERAAALGIPFVVLHPGSHLGAGEKTGLKTIASHLREVFAATRGLKVRIALETTAGQGSCLGWQFEHLSELYERIAIPTRLAVCFDTCHVLAAGYDLARKPEQVLKEFDRIVGLEKIAMFHFNDSKGARGSRIDRHEHIGKGHVGIEAFRVILNDKRFLGVPKILETPKDPDGKLDRKNLRILRALIR